MSIQDPREIEKVKIVMLKGEKGDVGSPTDAQVYEQIAEWISEHPESTIDEDIINESVDSWLEEHPEATTTVLDKSLGIEKLTDEAWDKITDGFLSLRKYELVHEFLYGNWENAYCEAITYNNDEDEIILGFYNFTDATTEIVILDRESFSIKGSYSYNFSIIGGMSYDSNSHSLIIFTTTNLGAGNEIIKIDTQNYSDSRIISPDGCPFVAVDDVTGNYVTLSKGANHNWEANLYESDFSTLISTRTFQLDDTDVPQQGFCIHNNVIYQITFYSIVSMNLNTGTIRRVKLNGRNEPEDICFINNVPYIEGHLNGVKTKERIYKFYIDGIPAINKSYQQSISNIISDTDDLNSLIGEGLHHCETSVASAEQLHYPNENNYKGLLIVASGSGMADVYVRVHQLFFSKISPYPVFYRVYYQGTRTWTGWTRIVGSDITKITNDLFAFKSSNDSYINSNGSITIESVLSAQPFQNAFKPANYEVSVPILLEKNNYEPIGSMDINANGIVSFKGYKVSRFEKITNSFIFNKYGTNVSINTIGYENIADIIASTIPSDYRPAVNIYIPCLIENSGMGILNISTTGVIMVRDASQNLVTTGRMTCSGAYFSNSPFIIETITSGNFKCAFPYNTHDNF